MQGTLFLALALVLIIEGLMPLLFPRQWRQLFQQIMLLTEEAVGEARGAHLTPRGRLRLHCPHGLGLLLMPLVAGWTGDFEDRFASEGNAAAVVRAGVGHDVFMLCPQRARASFERAAEMGSAIGAYNAGLMYADTGDHATAIAWLEKARALGEPKAGAALVRLGEPPAAVQPGP